ncbi:MAG: heavy-metal-associated domain-containing protein [Tannerella sp.]|jgi:copper chaperone CopZ|nr:heavy-metal-associated domain-containing protein [Tannerella sp.]
MKRIIIIAICALFTLSMASAQEKKDNKKTTKFLIANMHCDQCVKKIEKNIAFEKGVTDLKCDLENKTAEITYRTDKNSDEQLIKAFEKIKYSAKVIEGEE